MLIGFPRSAGEIRIQRYTISGAIDPSYPAYTFSMPYAPGSESASASTDPSGKIYASAGGLLVRLDSDGTLDPGFQPYQIANCGTLMGLQATAAGALLFDQVTTGGPHLYLIGESVTRLGSARIVDPSYPTLTIPALAAPQPFYAAAFGSDGSLYTTDTNYSRLLPLSYGPPLAAPSGFVTSVFRNGIVRLDANGNVDRTFWAQLGANTTDITQIVPLANGQLLVAGSFTVLNGVPRPGLARLTPHTAAYQTHLANLSCRAFAGQGPQTFIAGFVTENGAKNLLLRGVGPGLTPFGVSGVLSRPEITLMSGQKVIASNEGWASSADASAIASAAANVEPSPFPQAASIQRRSSTSPRVPTRSE